MSSPESADNSDWLERIWEYREEKLYPELFGDIGKGIYPLSAEMFLNRFKQETYDPRWLFFGVFESAPCAKHESWLYVSSGLSNPWNFDQPDDDDVSGFGCEFIFETTERGEWAIELVQSIMTFQVLLCSGRYERKEPVSPYDRIPLRASITPEADSEIRNILVCPPTVWPETFRLESGEVALIQLVGITDAEAQFAREHSGEELVERLRQKTLFPVTQPERHSVVS